MKRFLSIFFLVIGFSGYSQGVLYGNHVVDAYMGFPNMTKYFQSLSLIDQPGTITSQKGLAPFGLRYGYMINDDISIGADIMYNYTRSELVMYDTIFADGNWQYIQTNASRMDSRIRIQARMNFHIPTLVPELDSYVGVGIGTNSRWIKTTTATGISTIMKGQETVLLPFSMRLCYGFRYFFSYNFGINGEVGLGGPLISLGLSYKM